MKSVLSFVGNLLSQTAMAVVDSLLHNWLILSIAIVTAVALRTYMNTEKISSALLKHRKISILASVAVGAFTPFCACGTMAVVVGMLSTVLPWGPVMAFLTSSPLMSPNGFVMTAGLINLRFAVALTIASVVIGIASGYITNVIERRTRFLENQLRYTGKPQTACCAEAQPQAECSCAASSSSPNSDTVKIAGPKGRETGLLKLLNKFKLRELAGNLFSIGVKQVLLYFSAFVAVGYLMNYFVPTTMISALFGAKSATAVPLAAVIGVPLYLSTESAIPMIQSLLQSGASEGAMLAFIITGSATSTWAIAGLLTFLKKKAVVLYIGYIVTGAILAGYIYEWMLVFLG